jgi:hypothetical protein
MSSVCGRACDVCSFDEAVIWFEPFEDVHGFGTECSECGTVYDGAGVRQREWTLARRAAGIEPQRSFSRP